MSLSFTAHAKRRMQQRGFSERDVRLIVQFGSNVRRGLRLLRKQDIDKALRRTTRHMLDLERLRNRAVVIEGETVVTCYHLHGEAGRRALRHDGRRLRRKTRRNGH